jgi:hypothetical protein
VKTWDVLDVESDEDEANLALIASTSSDADSDVDSKDDDKVFSKLTREELIIVVRYLIRNY